MTPEKLAELFHAHYERLAPGMGYETRVESAVPWEFLPERNKALMVAVAEAVMTEIGEMEETEVDRLRSLIHRLVPPNWRERERRKWFREAYSEAEEILGCVS